MGREVVRLGGSDCTYCDTSLPAVAAYHVDSSDNQGSLPFRRMPHWRLVGLVRPAVAAVVLFASTRSPLAVAAVRRVQAICWSF